MPPNDGLLLAACGADVEPIARKLRAVVLKGFPEAIEIVRLGDRAASFGVGPKWMSEAHVDVMPQAAYVNLGFHDGRSRHFREVPTPKWRMHHRPVDRPRRVGAE